MTGPTLRPGGGGSWYYTGTVGQIEWDCVQEGPNETFYVVSTANVNNAFGAKVNYQGPYGDYVYHFSTKGPLSGVDVANFMASASMGTLAALATPVTITDCRGNTFTGRLWGIPKIHRPKDTQPFYKIECWMKNPSGSITL